MSSGRRIRGKFKACWCFWRGIDLFGFFFFSSIIKFHKNTGLGWHPRGTFKTSSNPPWKTWWFPSFWTSNKGQCINFCIVGIKLCTVFREEGSFLHERISNHQFCSWAKRVQGFSNITWAQIYQCEYGTKVCAVLIKISHWFFTFFAIM